MFEILSSSILGNVLGIISIIIAVLTLFKTRLVASEVKKLKTETIKKVRFGDYLPIALSSLEDKLYVIKRSYYISETLLCDLLEITRTLIDFSFGLSPESEETISDAYNFIKNTNSSILNENRQLLTKLFDYLTQIINILKKGE